MRPSPSSCRARSTPTSWSPAEAPAPPTSRATTTWADCPTTRVRARRAAAHAVQGRGAPGRRAARPAPRDRVAPALPRAGLGNRIIGEVTRARLDLLRQADAIAREVMTAAGLDRDIWADARRAARRRALRRRPGRRPHLRPPGRAAAGHLRGRHDGRLGAPAVRGHGGSPRASPTRSRRSTGSRSTSPPSPRAPSSGSETRPLTCGNAAFV